MRKRRDRPYQMPLQNPVDLLSKWFNSITIPSNAMTLLGCFCHYIQILFPITIVHMSVPFGTVGMAKTRHMSCCLIHYRTLRYKILNRIEMNEENTVENKINFKIQVFGISVIPLDSVHLMHGELVK